MYSLSSLIKQVRMVWSIVQARRPILGSASSNQILDAYILNVLMQFLKFSSRLVVPVTPIIVGSNKSMNFLIFSEVSLSGSTETKIDLRSKKPASRDYLTFFTALLSFVSEFGQISGQFVNPKQMRQQLPSKFALENGFPFVSVSYHFPPMAAFPEEVTFAFPVIDFLFLDSALTDWISMQTRERRIRAKLPISMTFPNSDVTIGFSLSPSTYFSIFDFGSSPSELDYFIVAQLIYPSSATGFSVGFGWAFLFLLVGSFGPSLKYPMTLVWSPNLAEGKHKLRYKQRLERIFENIKIYICDHQQCFSIFRSPSSLGSSVLTFSLRTLSILLMLEANRCLL